MNRAAVGKTTKKVVADGLTEIGKKTIVTVVSVGAFRYTGPIVERLAAKPAANALVPKNAASEILATPNISNPKLQNIINSLYKGTANPGRVANGTTADAIRHELTTGQPVRGRFHSVKGAESIRALENWLRRNPDGPFHDRLVAHSVLDDLRSAMGGGP